MSVQAFINGAWTDVADVAAPSGVMVMWPGAAVQSGGVYIGPNTGWLLCNGQAVSRTIYAALFQAIGTTWGAGDGSTTFNLPDMQEAAPVGVGASGRTEATHDTYTLGQFKDDQFESHIHNLPFGTIGLSGGAQYGGTNPNAWTSFGSTNTPAGDGTDPLRTGSVTRGKRMGVNFIIKS